MEDVSLEWSKADLHVSEQSCLVREGPYSRATLFQAHLIPESPRTAVLSTMVLLQN